MEHPGGAAGVARHTQAAAGGIRHPAGAFRHRHHRRPHGERPVGPELSIIIPAWNEEDMIACTLGTLCSAIAGRNDIEIIVSVSGDDRTAGIASAFPVVVCLSETGRAVQMNAGAAEASGRILYFLHADTIPPATFCDDILEAVRAGHPAGCFRMEFDDPHWIMQLYGWFTQFPLSICRGGDQSLFITRQLFTEIGGFDSSMQVMEDIEIIDRIERRMPFHILDRKVTTSSRKYQDNGMIRLQAVFGMIHLMYALGYRQEELRDFYRDTIS
ncbi:MAG: glycosyltransferase family 2 protein [Chlorobiaceae bacterium]|nr:glycosyltransferase family 2 protein [Chlorobiaceae bacterium]